MGPVNVWGDGSRLYYRKYDNSDKDDDLAELLRVIVVNYTIYGSGWVQVMSGISVPGTTSPWYVTTYNLAKH